MSMTVEEAVREIRRPGHVYVWTRLFDDDAGRYVEVCKDSLVAHLEETGWDTATVKAVRHKSGLYID